MTRPKPLPPRRPRRIFDGHYAGISRDPGPPAPKGQVAAFLIVRAVPARVKHHVVVAGLVPAGRAAIEQLYRRSVEIVCGTRHVVRSPSATVEVAPGNLSIASGSLAARLPRGVVSPA